MPSCIFASCPRCGVTVNGDLNLIDKVFGFRVINNEKKIIQSHCRNCRRDSSKQRRLDIKYHSL